jgi:thiol-disulfide isomerase/thioredoxin
MLSAHLLVSASARGAAVASSTGRVATSSSLLNLQYVHGPQTLDIVSIARNRSSHRTSGAVALQGSFFPACQSYGEVLQGLKARKKLGKGFVLNHGRGGRRAAGAARMALAVDEEIGAAPSWEGLAEKLGNLGKSERISQASERVFGSEEEKTRVVLYRDSWSWCPYCERVWLQLEEKQISYSIENIDMSCYGEKPAWYTDMVPSGLLPAVKIDSQLLTENMDIMKQLEEKFPDKTPLLPSPESPEFAVVDELLKLEREVVGSWINRLISEDSDDESFSSAMDKVETALQRFGGPYFLGGQVRFFSVSVCSIKHPYPKSGILLNEPSRFFLNPRLRYV